MNICAVCGKELQDSTLIEWEAMPGIAWHADCDWTSDGRAWFEAQRRANPRLNRQVELRTMGLEQQCQECGHEQSVNPTAIGMDPSPWDVNCTACGEYWPDAVNASRNQDIVSALWRLRRDFELGQWDVGHEDDLSVLDSHLPTTSRHSCALGGQFSFTARVRCQRCAAMLPVRSWFHYGYQKR